MPHETPSLLKRTVVALEAPVSWFDKAISEVTVQEPSAAAFFQWGDPVIFAGDGKAGALVEVPDAMAAYVDACIKVEQPGQFLKILGLRDGRALKRALLDFFRVEPETAPA